MRILDAAGPPSQQVTSRNETSPTARAGGHGTLRPGQTGTKAAGRAQAELVFIEGGTSAVTVTVGSASASLSLSEAISAWTSSADAK